MNKNLIKLARNILKKNWGNEGVCDSCGWFPMLSEHDIDDDDIIEAIEKEDGTLILPCLNKDRECNNDIKIDVTEFTLYHGKSETIISISEDNVCICCNNPESEDTACVCYPWNEFQDFIDIFQ